MAYLIMEKAGLGDMTSAIISFWVLCKGLGGEEDKSIKKDWVPPKAGGEDGVLGGDQVMYPGGHYNIEMNGVNPLISPPHIWCYPFPGPEAMFGDVGKSWRDGIFPIITFGSPDQKFNRIEWKIRELNKIWVVFKGGVPQSLVSQYPESPGSSSSDSSGAGSGTPGVGTQSVGTQSVESLEMDSPSISTFADVGVGPFPAVPPPELKPSDVTSAGQAPTFDGTGEPGIVPPSFFGVYNGELRIVLQTSQRAKYKGCAWAQSKSENIEVTRPYACQDHYANNHKPCNIPDGWENPADDGLTIHPNQFNPWNLWYDDVSGIECTQHPETYVMDTGLPIADGQWHHVLLSFNLAPARAASSGGGDGAKPPDQPQQPPGTQPPDVPPSTPPTVVEPPPPEPGIPPPPTGTPPGPPLIGGITSGSTLAISRDDPWDDQPSWGPSWPISSLSAGGGVLPAGPPADPIAPAADRGPMNNANTEEDTGEDSRIFIKATGPDGCKPLEGTYGQYSGIDGEYALAPARCVIGCAGAGGDTDPCSCEEKRCYGAPFEENGKWGPADGGELKSEVLGFLALDGQPVTDRKKLHHAGAWAACEARPGGAGALASLSPDKMIPVNGLLIVGEEIRQNMKTSATMWERHYRTLLGGFNGPGARIQVTNEPRQQDYVRCSYKFDGGSLPTGGQPFCIPAGPDKMWGGTDRNYGIIIAELQVWAGKYLEQGEGHISLFIDSCGEPVSPKEAEKELGKPHILMHWATNWLMGTNTGSLGQKTDRDGKKTSNPEGQFKLVGKGEADAEKEQASDTIKRYIPDPDTSPG